jgi:hypothetical protein
MTDRTDTAHAEGEALVSDARELRRQLRARDRVYAAAYDEGVRGARFDPEVWPDDPAVLDAYTAGVDERRTRRRQTRRTAAWAALRWCGRHLAPRTARRMRRMRRRGRRVHRALSGAVRAR